MRNQIHLLKECICMTQGMVFHQNPLAIHVFDPSITRNPGRQRIDTFRLPAHIPSIKRRLQTWFTGACRWPDAVYAFHLHCWICAKPSRSLGNVKINRLPVLPPEVQATYWSLHFLWPTVSWQNDLVHTTLVRRRVAQPSHLYYKGGKFIELSKKRPADSFSWGHWKLAQEGNFGCMQCSSLNPTQTWPEASPQYFSKKAIIQSIPLTIILASLACVL